MKLFGTCIYLCMKVTNIRYTLYFNPFTQAKFVFSFGLSECNRVNIMGWLERYHSQVVRYSHMVQKITGRLWDHARVLPSDNWKTLIVSPVVNGYLLRNREG